jgi:hypothetical protein
MGKVRIYSFALADAMCDLYEIKLTKNHLPTRSSEPVCSIIRPAKEPDMPKSSQSRGKSRGMGRRGQEDRNDNFAARDFRETDKSWQPAPAPKKPAWGKKDEGGPSSSRKGATSASAWGRDEDEDRFEDPEPQLSQSLRKPKNPGELTASLSDKK